MSRADRTAVRRLTHRRGPNFSIGFRFLPPAKRRAVYAAYAVCRVADDIVDEVDAGEEPEGARRRLDAWEAEIRAAYAGQPSAPETRALAEVLHRFPIPKEAFLGLVEGCRWDLERTRYRTWAELERYCELVAVTIARISLAIFGAVDGRAQAAGRELALALQLTNICRDVAEDWGRGRVYLPLEDLERFGVPEEELAGPEPPPGFLPLMRFETARAAARFRAANPLPRYLEPDSRLAVRLMGRVYAVILRRIAAEPARVLRERVALGWPAAAGVVLGGVLGRPFLPAR